MLHMKIGCAIIVLVTFLFQGCGSLTHGPRQDLSITTTPPGATVTIDNLTCKTPCSLNVARSSRYVTLQIGTYRGQYILDKTINYGRAFWGNIIWLIPGISDKMGGVYDIAPVNITLDNADLVAAGDAAYAKEAGDTRSEAAPADKNTYAWSFGVSGYRGRGASGDITHFSYEKMLPRFRSIYAKLEFISHRSDRRSFTDTASGTGGEIGMRFYFRDRVLEGWYWGGGLGFWSMKGDWQDDVGTPFVTTGHSEATVADLNFHTGYKWYPRKGHFFIDPSLGVGVLFPGGTPDPFGPGGGYIRAGLAAGMRW